MLRYVWPLIMLASTGAVWQYNGSHDDSKLLLPGMHLLFPATEGDPVAMGERTIEVMIGVSIVFLLWTVVDHLRAIRRRERREREAADE